MDNPSIVVIGFNRPKALKRLLNSLNSAEYPDTNVPLFISIDYHKSVENGNVIKIANEFNWKFGKKKVIVRERNYGLKEHILACGDILLEGYESLIMLEDDLYVSPFFYDYAKQVNAFYKENNLEKIAGFSLYTHKFNETAGLPFEAVDDGYDNFFLQMPSSWGQMWTRDQWKSFRTWYSQGKTIIGTENLPDNILKGSKKSWKWIFTKYIVENDLFFVYPRSSLSTNFGDSGTHHSNTNNFQVSLLLKRKEFEFSEFINSYSCYDSFCELLPRYFKDSFGVFDKDITIDLYGKKDIKKIKSKYLVSIKKCDNSIYSFGLQMKPIELNIINELPGGGIHYAETRKFNSYVDKNRFIELEYYYLSLKNIRRLIDVLVKMVFNRIKDKF